MKNMLLFSFWAFSFPLLFSLVFLPSCTKKSAPAPAEMTAEQLQKRGQSIYVSNCIACHNVVPSKDGSVGPAVSGSSLELIEARILRADYPTGYKPKRETHQMAAFPNLKNEIPALNSYLNSSEVLNAH